MQLCNIQSFFKSSKYSYDVSDSFFFFQAQNSAQDHTLLVFSLHSILYLECSFYGLLLSFRIMTGFDEGKNV